MKKTLIFLFVFLLPTQLGKHFFLPFSFLSGIRVDFLAPTVYLTDVLAFFILIVNWRQIFKFFKQKWLIVLLLLLSLNTIFSLNSAVSLYRLVKIVEWLIIFSVFKNLRKKDLPLVFSAFFLGSLFQIILTVLQFVNKHSLQGIWYFFGERYLSLSMPGLAKASIQGVEFLRPYGTFSHPNSMAGFYLLIYMLILTTFSNITIKQYNNILNIFKNFFLLISSLLVFLSFSKIAILTLIFLTTIYLLLSTRNKCRLCFFAKIISLVVVALIFVSARTDPLSLEKRLTLINNSLRIFADHPIFGVGLGNYLITQAKYPTQYLYFLNQPVHNIFLLFLTETGIIISSIVGWLIVRWLKTKKILLTFNSFLLTPNFYLLVTILITGSFDHYWLTLQQNFLLLAIILAVV